MGCRCELRNKIKNAAVPWIPERSIYMDYNATTAVDPRVIGAFERACRRSWGNPSSLHSAGIAGWNELEKLYETAAAFFGTAEEGFHLCSSGTEALTSAVFGTASRNKASVYITTAVEHQAVKHPLFHLDRKSPAAPAGFSGTLKTLPVNQRGEIDPQELDSLLSCCGKAVIVYSPVNHETGAVQPVREIAEAADKYEAAVILDAVQAAARLNAADWAPFCDIFCISGHKLYAPKGTALLWKRPDLRIRPLRYGGSQQGGLFPGTENIPGAAALCEALKLLKKEQHNEHRMLASLSRDGISILEKAGIDFIVESPPQAVPGVLCISLKKTVNMEELMIKLNRANICISRFSACSEKLDGASAVLEAMGVPKQRAEHSLRISLGRWSRRDDFFKLAAALKSI